MHNSIKLQSWVEDLKSKPILVLHISTQHARDCDANTKVEGVNQHLKQKSIYKVYLDKWYAWLAYQIG